MHVASVRLCTECHYADEAGRGGGGLSQSGGGWAAVSTNQRREQSGHNQDKCSDTIHIHGCSYIFYTRTSIEHLPVVLQAQSFLILDTATRKNISQKGKEEGGKNGIKDTVPV